MEEQRLIEAPSGPRARVILFLAFLSSEACLDACRRFADPEEIAFHLCRLWLDAVYTPALAYSDGIKGDLRDEEVAAFEADFTDEEMKALERFHRFFELRLEMLPAAARRAGRFPETDLWRNLVKDARYLLEDLDPDPEKLRRWLAWLIDERLRAPDELASAWRALLDAK